MTPTTDPAPTRPRVEGDREQEILTAALDVLADVGYDRLTMDSVAARARASKATLYRRWATKSALVIEALLSMKGPAEVVDTGTLRGDLLGQFCGSGGLTDRYQMQVFVSIITAIGRDEEFAEAFRRDFIGPKVAATAALFERARARGEIDPGVDVGLLGTCLAGTVLHHKFLLGEEPTTELVTRVVDQIILPAAAPTATTQTTTDPDTTDPDTTDTTAHHQEVTP